MLSIVQKVGDHVGVRTISKDHEIKVDRGGELEARHASPF